MPQRHTNQRLTFARQNAPNATVSAHAYSEGQHVEQLANGLFAPLCWEAWRMSDESRDAGLLARSAKKAKKANE